MRALDDLLAQLISGDDTQAEQAAQLLPEFGDTAYQKIQANLNHSDPDVRWWSVRVLCNFNRPEISITLIEKLSDESEAVRQCAALGLSIHPAPEAIPVLIKLLSEDDTLLPRLASNALIKIGKKATPGLLDLLNAEDTPQQAKLEATRALALIGDTDAISALFKLIDNDSALLEYWANEGLDNMGVGMAFFDPK